MEGLGEPIVNIGIFLFFVAVTLVIVFRASRNNKTATDYYAAGHAFTGPQNGIAISGDYLSAASFLGIAGAIAVNGYDGFLYSIGFLVAWLVALLLVAELLRNTGRYTMADVLSFRMRQRPVRVAAATSTLAVSFFYLLAQMAGAGGLVALLLGVTNRGGQSLVIAVVGALMITYVLVGGMRGTTWVQIIKAVLLIGGAGIMTIWVLAKYGFNLSSLLGAAVDSGGEATANILEPRQPVRRLIDEPARLHLACAGSRARHRRPAARADALLHRADRAGGAAIGGVGDLADRHLLPVHAGPGVRRCRPRGRRNDRCRTRQGEFRCAAAGVRARWHDLARRSSRRWRSRRFSPSSLD